MIQELEEKLVEMFLQKGIGTWICEDALEGAKTVANRWMNTTKYVAKTEEDYIEALKLRLKQGGVKI